MARCNEFWRPVGRIYTASMPQRSANAEACQTSQQVKHVHSEMQLVFESAPRIQAILAHHGDHRSWRTICGFRIPPFWTKTLHDNPRQ